MAQEIYNEGRVVGLSAWEIFLKEALSNGVDPNDIPDEKQWLASMIGMGNSMILKIPGGTPAGVHDFELPVESRLSAAGVIIASPFLGECSFTNSSSWAKKVISYGPLILNNDDYSPTSSTVPSGSSYPSDIKNIVSEFIKITDGVVFVQNAKWIPTASGEPKKDIDPNLNESTSVVRLYINSDISTGANINILLTGFTNKRILQSLSGHAVNEDGYAIGGSTDILHNDWQNGGMVGPEIFPWSSKIIFSVPSYAYNLLNSLTRTIPSDDVIDNESYDTEHQTLFNYTLKDFDSATISSNSFLDFNSIKLEDYYVIHINDFDKMPIIKENVEDVVLGLGEVNNIITAWYPGLTADEINSAEDSSKFFPPAVYGTQISATGEQSLIPLDTAAPGTVKGFDNPQQAYNYRKLLPDNYAVYYDSNTDMFSFVTNLSEYDPSTWAGLSRLTFLSGDYPKANLTVGNEEARIITLSNSNGTDYGVDGVGGTTVLGPENNITWDVLLKSLKTNKQVDVLGAKLHNLGTELKTSNTIGITNTLTESGADKITVTGTASVSMTTSTHNGTDLLTVESGSSIKSGTDFIEFANGLRLYISSTEPSTTGVPIGSIGIGW